MPLPPAQFARSDYEDALRAVQDHLDNRRAAVKELAEEGDALIARVKEEADKECGAVLLQVRAQEEKVRGLKVELVALLTEAERVRKKMSSHGRMLDAALGEYRKLREFSVTVASQEKRRRIQTVGASSE